MSAHRQANGTAGDLQFGETNVGSAIQETLDQSFEGEWGRVIKVRRHHPPGRSRSPREGGRSVGPPLGDGEHNLPQDPKPSGTNEGTVGQSPFALGIFPVGRNYAIVHYNRSAGLVAKDANRRTGFAYFRTLNRQVGDLTP